ncbi:MAG: hypothetical protein ACI841_003953 [Planctomycetota bacterium]|jgi:hypothetical protein
MVRNGIFALVGLVLGWLLATSLVREPVQESNELTQTLTPAPEIEALAPAALEPLRDAGDVRSISTADSSVIQEPEGDEPSPRVLGGPFNHTLVSHFHLEFEKGWKSERPEAVSEAIVASGELAFRRQTLALPFQIGRDAASAANDADALESAIESGDGLVLLAAGNESTSSLSDEDHVSQLIKRVFEPRSSSGTIDGANFLTDASTELVAGSTIRFGPGVHAMKESRLRGPDGNSLPSDIRIVGAGMGLTLLRIGDISIHGDVERLSFRDLTLDSENDGLFDMRRGGLTLDLERVRVVRFDAGHGGCYVFSVRGGAVIRALECEFVGGYGRSPGSGYLYRSNTILAEFDNCLFDTLEFGTLSDSRVTYRGCTFEGMRTNPSDNSASGVSFIECRFGERRDPAATRESLTLDLADLFWQVREEE